MDARRRRWVIGGVSFIGIWPLLCILVISFGFFSLTPYAVDWSLLTYYGQTELVIPASEGSGYGLLSPQGRYMMLAWGKYGKGWSLWDTRSGTQNPRLLPVVSWFDSGRWLSENAYAYAKDEGVTIVYTDQWRVEPLAFYAVTDSSNAAVPLSPDRVLSLREEWKTAKALYVLSTFSARGTTFVIAESPTGTLTGYSFAPYGIPPSSTDPLFQGLPAVDITSQSYKSTTVGFGEGYPSYDATLAAIAPSRQGTVRLVDQQQHVRAMASHLVGYPRPIGWSEDGQSFYFQILTDFSPIPGYTAIFKITPLSPLQQTWTYLRTVLVVSAVIGAVRWWRRRKETRSLQNEEASDSA